MELWHWWVITALILFLLEIFFSDFLLAMLGLAALDAAVVAALHLSFPWQLGVFVGASILALILLRPFLKKLLYRSTDGYRSNHDGLPGVVGTVLEAVGDESAPGRVKVGSEEWRAISATPQSLPVGDSVEVVRIESATIFVRPRQSKLPDPSP